ncbi:MAG: VOC family protein [Chloroflexota bacterium]
MITPVLRVHDVDLSMAFYTRVLGFEGQGGLPGLDGRTLCAEAWLGDARILFSRKERHPCGAELYITLPEKLDFERFYASLKARAVCVIDDLHIELWGDHAFTIIDLDGNRLTFAQPLRFPVHIPKISLAHTA